MRRFRTTMLVLLIVSLFLSAIGKVLAMPGELEFYAEYGFTALTLTLFGIEQVVCIALLLNRKTRFLGAALGSVNFAVMSVLTIGTEAQPLLIWLLPTCIIGIYLCADGLRNRTVEG